MPTRISGACNGCRTKKQKCSGDRSGCSQCAAAGISCTWPEQRKRGPAKGYIEGLEHRLHEAETLLLALLPLVTPSQLNQATESLNDRSSPNHLTMKGRDSSSPSPRTRQFSPPVLNKKTGIDYWESFPLDTVENIRRWQEDCALHNAGQLGTERANSFSGHETHHRAALLEQATIHSRPSSVDLSRESFTMSHASSNPHSVFRNMSADATYRSRTATPVNGPMPMTSLSMSHVPATATSASTTSTPNWQSLSLFSPLGNSDTPTPTPQSSNAPNMNGSNGNTGGNNGHNGAGNNSSSSNNNNATTEAMLLQSFADQSWANVNSQAMGMGLNTGMGIGGGMNGMGGMGMGMDSGPMEIDTGFFSNEVQRRLFW